MADHWRSPSSPAHVHEPWRVRVRAAGGAVVGAGVLLGGRYLLTCARVVAGAQEVVVDLVGVRGAPSALARVVPAPDGDPGDLALLELDPPQPEGTGAVLRQTALSWERDVHTWGYPRGREQGVRAPLVLAPRGDSEWLRMDPRPPGEQQVRAGFAGAGVADDETGEVLGVVVGDYADEAADPAWMLPVETIRARLPETGEWAVGGPAIDALFSEPVDPAATADREDVARALTGWLGSRDSGPPVLILVGAELAVLRRTVALSDPGSRRRAGRPPSGALPAVGSVDLALDAAGMSAEEVSRRVVDRAGLSVAGHGGPGDRVRAGTPPMTIVVDGVDDAERPQELLERALRPLAEGGARLVLGFRRESSPSLAAARAWQADALGERLDRLSGRVRELTEAERVLLVRHGRPGERAARLRLRLHALRRMADSDPEWVRQELDECERAVARALRRAGESTRRAEDAKARSRELLGLLDAYKTMAAEAGLAEDPALAAEHRRAHALLTRGVADPLAARQAVRGYGAAVRRAVEGTGDGR